MLRAGRIVAGANVTVREGEFTRRDYADGWGRLRLASGSDEGSSMMIIGSRHMRSPMAARSAFSSESGQPRARSRAAAAGQRPRD